MKLNKKIKMQARSESTTQTLQREKRSLDEKNKEITAKIRRLEGELATEEAHREQARLHLNYLPFNQVYMHNNEKVLEINYKI